MMRPVPRGTLALAGMAAGMVVGLGDGLSAGIAVDADLRGTVLAALLAASVDALLGAALGSVTEVVARVAQWGRGARAPRWATAVAAIIVGVAVAALTVAVAVGTVDRRNRFLAAGLTSLLACGGGIVGAAVLPGVSRLLGRSRSIGVVPRRPDPGLLLLAPLAIVVVAAVVMGAAIALATPLVSGRAIRHLMLAGVEAGLLPVLLLWAERMPARVRFRSAAVVSMMVFGGPLLFFVTRNWGNHLRFVAWTHVLPGVVMFLIAIANVPWVGPRVPLRARRRVVIGAGGAGLMVLVLLVAAESETARKVTSSRAGLVGPVLASARRVLDWDRDGYPRLLGGGDCDERDPAVHPGVLDFPDDGIDQDCDGRDASVAVLAPPPFAPVPDTVPRDLNLLLITIDTVRADHLGCYGYPRPTSPEIDRLAADGALFVNGWAHAPSTRYSMPAIATGRWPTAIAWD